MEKKRLFALKSLALFILAFGPVSVHAGQPIIIDSRHYSNVFGEIRNFRIFLPPDYFKNPLKNYPVIYFLHGWSQRYFGSINKAGSDTGNDNHGDNIGNFVANHEVIVVKPDGYNRNPGDEYYLRPYNIGPVETYRQFPAYFPELVEYIDANFHTIADRDHRAISGLSMGGFMTFWIGGKYPQLFSAAGNFCGSPEFIVGPKNFPAEFRHLDMYKNYNGMNVRLNYGDKDFIRCYHKDMNRIWTQVMDNYQYRVYDAGHTTCGLGEMFDFFLETFENPPGKPEKWHHIDVYPEFSVWDYHVSSDRNVPGFTILENVNERGFRSSVREFVPDGTLMPFVNMSVTTSPVYEKDKQYIINDVDPNNGAFNQKIIQSDSLGRLKINLDGNLHEIGINRMGDSPNICLASFRIMNMNWATQNRNVNVSIKLLNKGVTEANGVKAKIYATRNNDTVMKNESEFGSIASNEIRDSGSPFTFYVKSDSIEIEKFKLVITDKNKNRWFEYFEIPLRPDQKIIKDFKIADGRTFVVAKAGDDTTTLYLGAGNGDGVPNPGESIIVLVKDQGRYWRTYAYSSDKYVNPFGINMRLSDSWGAYDHVGGSAKYSAPLISSGCPEKHEIEFFLEYWIPDYPYHIIRRGKIKVKVTGKDSTPPIVQWVQIPGDNIIQTRVYDGSEIQFVKAKLIPGDNPENFFEIDLKDNGENGDRAMADR